MPKKQIMYAAFPARVQNPYRDGTQKWRAFEICRPGGRRDEVVTEITHLGVTVATACTWVWMFKKVVFIKGGSK